MSSMSRDEKVTRRREERARDLRFHVAALAAGVLILGVPWVVVEYVNAGGWPDRFDDNGVAGSWNPFVPAVLLVWTLFVVIRALRVRFDRPRERRS